MSVEVWTILVLGLAFVFYSTVTILLLIGLGRTESYTESRTPYVSVIVAARNEEENLPRLLDALALQSYQSYEIIIVDDGSTDRTSLIVRMYAKKQRNLSLVLIDPSTSHQSRKKSALATGILSSRGEILCFTDADCIPGTEWISEIVKRFTENVGLVAGYSPYDKDLLPSHVRSSGFFQSLLQHFVRYEELKGAIWSAGSIGLRKGWLCTGRNLAYRRKVWDEVGGFSRIMMSISGDDDLFLQQVRRTTDWGIVYALDPRSFVPTSPPHSFSNFVEQRKRHFSAGKFFTIPMKSFFLLFHGSNLLLYLGLLAGLLSPVVVGIGIVLFIGKVIIDIALIGRAGSVFSEHDAWLRVLPMEFLYLLYNTLIGPLGFLTGFEWKPDLK